MKKTILIGLAFLAIVMVAAYFSRIKPSALPEEMANDNYEPIVLYVESGEVSYKKPDQNTFNVVATGSVKIPSMTIVETKVGLASVLLPDNSTISLEENTQITVDYAPSKTSIFQSFGMTYHRVEKLLGGASYQVQTPETLAAVRGTKFAVNYDKATKKTKVSVTESIVEVGTLNKGTTATGTSEMKESRMVTVGEMALVAGTITSTSTAQPIKISLSVIKTDSDKEMRETVKREKAKDEILEDIKKNFKDKKEVRDEIQKKFFKDEDREGKNDIRNDRDDKENNDKNDERDDDKEKKDNEKKDESDSQSSLQKRSADELEKKNSEARKMEEKKAEEKRAAQKKSDAAVAAKKEAEIKDRDDNEEGSEENRSNSNGSTVNTRTTVVAPVKMSEEQYFTKFEDMFVRYFLIENDETFCNVKLSPEEKVKAITSFAQSSGYPISKDLLPFAKALSQYCEKRDPALRKALESRFDEDYPY